MECNIDLNVINDVGSTGFHDACFGGPVETVELIIKNSVEYNIDLNVKNDDGSTGFHQACSSGHAEAVELIIKKSVKCNIDLNAENDDGDTGYALSGDRVKKLILDNSAQFNIDLN